MVGAVLNTLNTRLDAEAIAFMLAHGEAKVLITDPEFAAIIGPALEMLEGPKPLVIDALDPEYPGTDRPARSSTRTSLPAARPTTSGISPRTSGMRSPSTTHPAPPETPRGCHHHRGAYLNAASNIISWGMPQHAVYLWTLPMFHCNGWCFPGPWLPMPA